MASLAVLTILYISKKVWKVAVFWCVICLYTLNCKGDINI